MMLSSSSILLFGQANKEAKSYPHLIKLTMQPMRCIYSLNKFNIIQYPRKYICHFVYLIPNDHCFLGQEKKTGHMNLLIHIDNDSSKKLIHCGVKVSNMSSFQAMIIPQNLPKSVNETATLPWNEFQCFHICTNCWPVSNNSYCTIHHQIDWLAVMRTILLDLKQSLLSPKTKYQDKLKFALIEHHNSMDANFEHLCYISQKSLCPHIAYLVSVDSPIGILSGARVLLLSKFSTKFVVSSYICPYLRS